MSYRDPAQSIEEPARDLIRAIGVFCDAVDARVESRRWQDTHISELILLVNRVVPLKYEFLRLAAENW